MPLTDTQIRAAKPAAKLYKLSDGGGLQLWVMPNGSKYWRLAYRRPADKKPDTASFGVYGEVSLAEARKQRDAARDLLRRGVDPKAHRRADKLARNIVAASTFDALADELLAKKRRDGRSEATIEYFEWLLALARPALGKRPIAELATSPAEILSVLQAIEGRGRLSTAQRLRAALGQAFNFAASTARASADPTPLLRGALSEARKTPRAAITDQARFGALLREIAGYEGMPETRIALTLIALTAARPGEIRAAEWSEFDLAAAVWTIPASRTKMRRDHRIPLSRQALALLDELKSFAGHRKHLFPGVRNPMTPMSEHTLSSALRNLNYPKDQMSAHGFRSAMSSIANESGLWHPDAIERALAHVDRNAVRGAYARGDYWPERIRMAKWWGDACDAMREKGAIEHGGDVIQFRRGQG
jgi:integrase